MEDHVARKYIKEREKRLLGDAATQYVDLQSEQLKDLDKDPFADPTALEAQEPLLRHGQRVKFLVVGCGHNGLLFACRLIEAGFAAADIYMVDNAGGFGGTWYWNRYPGVMCDVEASIYLPLLEETGFIPKHRYAFGYEIRDNAEKIAAAYKLRAMFYTKICSQVWDEARGAWTVQMQRGRGHGTLEEDLTITAQYVFGAWGYFFTPQVPRLPGLDELRAHRHVFHTARWDYGYTGGSQEDPALVRLKDKVVGIVGTGATAVQVVPELARWAKHLYVFQRTPSHCFPRARQPTDLKSWHGQVARGHGWQYERQCNFEHFISGDPSAPAARDLVGDGWTCNPAYAGSVGSRMFAAMQADGHLAQSMLELDRVHVGLSHAFVDREVRDAATADKLKAWYAGWCKRPTFHDGYLGAFNQDNVTLVDTNGRGIERYTSSGLVANGVQYGLDLVVFATGFAPSSRASPAQRMDGVVLGRDGQSIHDKWRSSRDHGTLFGLMTHGFPNMFFYAVSGIGSSPNLTPYYDRLARLAAHILAAAHGRAGDTASDKLIVEASAEAEKRYTDQVEKRHHWYSILDGCTPGYYNGEGEALRRQPTPQQASLSARASGWGGGPVEYDALVRSYMATAGLEGIEVRTGGGLE